MPVFANRKDEGPSTLLFRPSVKENRLPSWYRQQSASLTSAYFQ